MNKKIIGISVAMLFAATGAVAQTSVTLYGTVDAGVQYLKGADPAGKVWSLQSGQQSYSRLGFKGTEDLGGGMKAMFVLEQGIHLDNGTSGIDTQGSNIPFFGNDGTFSSQAFVGLGGNFGAVSMGRQYSPLYEAYGTIDPFMNGFAANINNFFGVDEGYASNYQRMSNAIIYHSPDNMGGFKGALAYGFGEQAGSVSEQSQMGLSLGYMNGPLTVSYAYHHANNEMGGPGFADSFKTHFIGGAYDFGAAKLHLAFDQNKRGSTFKTEDYLIGVTVPMGQHAVFADFTHKKVKERTFLADDANASQFAIGYTYAMSKRSNAYAAYTHVKNNSNSFIDTLGDGSTVNVFQVGVRHMF